MRHVPTSGCRFCGRSFKRQDHLDRHELSHGEAQFRCNHPSCGMMFHRQDVLKRHQKVHQLDSVKRRRQPRRGVTPKSVVASESSIRSTTHENSNVPNVVMETPTGSLSVPPVEVQLDPFKFCLLHFKQACATRWPFMHHTSLHGQDMLPEMKLAMASLGGCSVPEYRHHALKFFWEAQSLFVKAQGQSCKPSDQNSSVHLDVTYDPDIVLAQFQTQVLLLECALWHAGTDAKQWAFKTTFELGSTTVPTLIEQIGKVSTEFAQQSWRDWVYQEQCVRALWTFYCVTQKAMRHFPCTISTFRSQRNLRLPQHDALFRASDERIWSRSKQKLLFDNPRVSDMTLESALQLLEPTDQTASYSSLADLIPMARHAVLVSLLEIYTGSAQSMLRNSEVSHQHQQHSHTWIGDSTRFGHVLGTVKSLWYVSPGKLLSSSPPRGVDLQNALLISHLEVLVLTSRVVTQDCLLGDSASQNLCAAANISADILITTHENDMLEVATKVLWLLDAACKQYVVGLERKMVRWVEYLEKQSSIAFSSIGNSHKLLYNRLTQFLNKLDRNSGRPERDLSDIQQFKDAIADAWCAILHCPFERWCAQQD